MIAGYRHRLRLFWTNEGKALQAFHVMRQAATLLVAILLPRLINTEAIGNFELLLYLNYLLAFAWTAGLLQAFLSLFPKQNAQQRQQFYFTAFVSFLLFALLIGGLTYLGRSWLVPVLSGYQEVAYLAPFLVYIALSIPSMLLENFLLLEKKARQLWAYGIFNALGYILALALPLYDQSGLGSAILALVVFAAVRFLFLLWFLLQHASWQWNQPLFKKWWVIALPLVAYALLSALNVSLDSWLVGHWYQDDETTFAIFRYGARELPFVTALSSGLASAMLPLLSARPDLGLDDLRSRSRRLFHLIYPLTIILLLSANFWFPLVFSDAFADSVPVFNTFLLITASRLLFGRVVLIGVGGQNVLPYLVLAGLVINVVCSLALVGSLGLLGIAVGTVIAFAAEAVLVAAWLYFRYRIPIQRYTDLTWWIFYVILLVSAYFWTIFAF